MGLTEKTREAVARIFNHVLTEEIQLSATTRNFLRHITGPNVHSLHRLFGDQDRQLARWLAEIKARARTSGAAAQAGTDQIAAAARSAVTGDGLPPRNMIGELLSLHEGVANRLRHDLSATSAPIGDPGTADFLSRLAEFHETTAWMLRVLLDGSNVGR